MNNLLIIRGLPGSGKSTFARQIVKGLDYIHFESDMYFTNTKGEYVFDAEKLAIAHDWCFGEVQYFLQYRGVIVSNTFSRKWEMQRYLDLPNPKQIIECQGQFGNIHNVPEDAILRMISRWERI